MRREFIDYDYAQELKREDPEALAWLAKFNSEYYGAAISKGKNGNVRKRHLHTTNAQAKEIFDDNNRRNNDVLGVTRANALLSAIDYANDSTDGMRLTNLDLQEQATVQTIDDQDESDVLLSIEEYNELKEQLTFEMQMFYESIYGDENEEK